LLRYFLTDLETVPVAPIITGITFVFTFHMHCIYAVRSLHFKVFSALLLSLLLLLYYYYIIIIIIIIIMHCRQGQKKFCSSPKRPNPLLGPTQPPIQWVPTVLFPWVERPGCNTTHLHAVTRLQISGAIPAPHLPAVFLHAVYRQLYVLSSSYTNYGLNVTGKVTGKLQE
jgi:hypothetical protein